MLVKDGAGMYDMCSTHLFLEEKVPVLVLLRIIIYVILCMCIYIYIYIFKGLRPTAGQGPKQRGGGREKGHGG